jgi:hypothetical protein
VGARSGLLGLADVNADATLASIADAASSHINDIHAHMHTYVYTTGMATRIPESKSGRPPMIRNQQRRGKPGYISP